MSVDLLDDLMELGAPRRPGVRANRDLKEWAQARQAPPEAPAEALAETCHVCRSRPARSRCRGCERPACASDLWVMFGLCTACASEERVSRWNREGKSAGGNWLEGGT